jgi:threonine dehydrogenase-like Zn-dependent dehydrogenase
MQHIRVSTFAGPGAKPVIHSVPWPKIPDKAALIQIGACGVCGTDLHILKGHWPKQLPWPFTLGHELGGIIVEAGAEFKEDFMSKPLQVGSRVMIPPLMPCGRCYYCIHYPESANKCLTPVYYGRYLGFDKPPHLWGGWAEYVYVDLDALPGTKIYKLPDDMPLRLGALALARKFGAQATVDIERYQTADARIARVRELVGGFGADLVMDCSGHPSAGPEGVEFLRDGGTYVEMGQFTDAGAITTSWHRFCAKDINVLGSWGFTGNDLPLGVDMLYRTRTKYPWLDMQTLYPFSEDGIARAVADAIAMKTVKSTIVPFPELIKDPT